MIKAIIEKKLKEAFHPVFLDLQDESHKHKHHSGWKEEGETHFKLIVASDAFNGQSRVERHKSIYKVLSSELALQVHALSIKALTEVEYTGSLD
jgi:BolA protein